MLILIIILWRFVREIPSSRKCEWGGGGQWLLNKEKKPPGKIWNLPEDLQLPEINIENWPRRKNCAREKNSKILEKKSKFPRPYHKITLWFLNLCPRKIKCEPRKNRLRNARKNLGKSVRDKYFSPEIKSKSTKIGFSSTFHLLRFKKHGGYGGSITKNRDFGVAVSKYTSGCLVGKINMKRTVQTFWFLWGLTLSQVFLDFPIKYPDSIFSSNCDFNLDSDYNYNFKHEYDKVWYFNVRSRS